MDCNLLVNTTFTVCAEFDKVVEHSKSFARTAHMNTSFISHFPPLVKNFELGMFFLGATLALGVVLSLQAVGTAIGSYNKGRLTINVKGVSVSSARVDAVRDLQCKSSDLMRDGVQIISDSPTYTCSTIENVKMTSLEKATQNRYDRAQVLVKSSGSTVGTLANASQGVFQIVAYGSTDVSDYGISDTSSIKKNAKAVVSMEYFVGK